MPKKQCRSAAGANTNHWRFNQPARAGIDLLGFGRSDQPRARLKDEPYQPMQCITALISGANKWLIFAAK